MANITRLSANEVDAVTVARRAFSKHYVTVHAGAGGDVKNVFRKVADFCRRTDSRIVLQDVFGPCDQAARGLAVLQQECGEVGWPVTWIEGNGTGVRELTGTQFYAVSGMPVEPVVLNGRVVGGRFEDEAAVYCFLGNMEPACTTDSRKRQTREVFESLEKALETVDMDFSNILRTWFYVDRILDWYGDFNDVRTDFFDERKVMEGLLPASTGVGASHPRGAALTAEAIALKPKDKRVRARMVTSPLQNPAPEYRSSFSRAVQVDYPDHCRLYISGTASIDADGETVHVGDAEGQIDLTMRVVSALLESCGVGWKDVSRAVAYFKDTKDHPLFDAYCRRQSLPRLPIAVAHSDICRDDLLFEIEVDAVWV